MTWLSRLVAWNVGAMGMDRRDEAAISQRQVTGSFETKGKQGLSSRAAGVEVVEQVVVLRRIAEDTQLSLRSAGCNGNEGMVLWSGIQAGTVFQVQTMITPRQRAITSAEGVCVIVDGDALHQVNVETYRRGERLLAQVHSHPGQAYHSEMDDRYAIVTSPGSLSIVVPDFATRAFSVADCAVYRLAGSGAWMEIPSREALKLISVQDR